MDVTPPSSSETPSAAAPWLGGCPSMLSALRDNVPSVTALQYAKRHCCAPASFLRVPSVAAPWLGSCPSMLSALH